MITKEEFEKAVECCTGFTVSCENCPLSEKDFKCGTYLAEYIKNEPALSANSTSSTKKENTFQIDDSTKSDICQVLASAMSTLLALYQEMEPHEKKAFDLGETYKDICCASAWMNSVRKGGDGK
ncbi:hypothetical protein [Ruminococcus bicirculans (ex Wegman et al. 2014)]|jgi:hypothetical protein|uniref:hypothetical protein n=1 Tax=Ruminococcus bicirculans (ex Wegman et al. 2014) TaxID=1160721 RepID=UPI00307E46D4